MQTTILRRFGLAGLLGLGVAAIGYAAAILIASRSSFIMTNIVFIEGIVALILGLMMSMKGNPSGTNLQGLGMPNANQISNLNMEATRTEREQTDYGNNFLKHAIVEFSLVSAGVLLGGLLLIIASVLVR